MGKVKGIVYRDGIIQKQEFGYLVTFNKNLYELPTQAMARLFIDAAMVRDITPSEALRFASEEYEAKKLERLNKILLKKNLVDREG